MQRDLRAGNGVFTSIFGGKSITSNDIKSIQAMNNAMKGGATYAQAWQTHMKGATVAAKQQAAQCIKNKGSLTELTRGMKSATVASKAAAVGMNLLATAGNMIAFMAISKGIELLVNTIDEYIHAAEIAREKSSELTDSWVEENSSIDDSISKYKELRAKLQDTSLTASEVKGVKEELLVVQQDLIDKYGQEALGIDLVNGKYDEQIAKLKKLSKQKAQDYVAENYSNIQEDKKYVSEKVNLNTSLGFKGTLARPDDYSDSGFDLGKYLERYDKLDAKVVETDGQYGLSGTVNLVTSGTREEVYEQLSQLFNDLSNDFGESNEDVNKFKETLSAIIQDSFDTEQMEKSKDNIKKYAEAQILSQNGTRKLYEEAALAVDKYNEALVSGKGVDEAKANLDSVKESVASATSDISGASYVFDDIYSGINSTAEKAYEITKAFENNTSVKEYAEQLKGLSSEDLLKIDFEDNVKQAGEEAFSSLIDVIGLSEDEVQALIDKLVELGYIQGSTSNNETDISSTFTTFKSLWKSIGKGDDDASKAAKSAKEEILKLAEAGKLTEKAFKKSSIADTFINAGYSIEETTKKINRMVDSSKQLSSLKSSISSIQDAYQEKKDNKVASSSTLAGMEDTFGKLSSWEKYKRILGSTSSTLKECKIAQNELATEFVYSNNFLSQLTSKNKEYYTSQLKELGIANAQSIVENTLKAKKQALANETKALEAATSDLSGETSNASEKFLEQANMTNLAKVELFDLIAKEKIFATNTDLNANQKIKQLSELAKAYFNVGIGISTAMGGHSNYYKSPEDYETAVNNAYDDFINQQTKISIDSIEISPKDTTKDKSKSKSSDTKQEIDWLSRRLTRMQSIIDLTASKLKNLFKIDKKENNIDKQIKQTTKLINQYGHAYDVYMSKANKVAKASGKGKNKVPALSKDIINKIQSGEITKDSYDKLIKKYGQKYADKINSYIDYYDKAQDSLKNKEEQIANKRELKKSKIQLRIDDAQSKIDRADTRIENATSASEKNKILNNEKKYYKELYSQKIKQAKLDKDSVEVGKLKAEKAKKLKDIQQEQYQNLIDEKNENLDLLGVQKENATSANEKVALSNQEYEIRKKIRDLEIKKADGDQTEIDKINEEFQKYDKNRQIENNDYYRVEAQSQLNSILAQKENAKTAAEKNALIDEELALRKDILKLDLSDAEINNNSADAERIKNEIIKVETDAQIEKINNRKEEIQSELDLLTAQKENAKTAAEKARIAGKELEKKKEQFEQEKQLALLRGDYEAIERINNEESKAEKDSGIEQNNYFRDEEQKDLDLVLAQKENAKTAAEKDILLDRELAIKERMYDLDLADAEINGDTVKYVEILNKREKERRDIEAERLNYYKEEKEKELNLLASQKGNARTASEKNAIVDQELAKKRELYKTESEIALLNGDNAEVERLKNEMLSEENKALIEKLGYLNDEYGLKENALNRDKNQLEQDIAEKEAKGVGKSVEDYEKLRKIEEQRKQNAIDRKKKLEEVLKTELELGHIVADESDPAYKEFMDSISSCDDVIGDCTVSQINYNKAINEMNVENYKTAISLLDSMIDKYERLQSLADVHNSKLSDEDILAQIGLNDEKIAENNKYLSTIKDNIRTYLTDELDMSAENVEEFIKTMKNSPHKLREFMNDLGFEDFNDKTYPDLINNLNEFNSTMNDSNSLMVEQENQLDSLAQKRIDILSEYLEALKKQKDYKDRIFAIEKAQYDLEKAKNNLTKKVWDGQQWVYTADTEAVQSAQESLDNAKFEEFNNSIQDLIEVLEQFIKDFNIYDDNGNMINEPDVILNKGVLGEYTIADIGKIFTDKVLDTSKLSGLMSNIQYAMPNVSIPNINIPDIQSRAMNQTVNYDKIELILPNITDASTGADLAKSFVNELKNLPSYAKQYDWNK